MRPPVLRTLVGAACATLLLSLSPLASGQLFRAYLAADGVDSRNCTLPQPCRLLPAALAAVADGGEIWMLDSANYNTGPVAINKSVTLLAVPGAVGSVVAAGGNAINVTTAGVRVVLRNLVIVPLPGTGYDGVLAANGAQVTVEGSLIANLPNAGISALDGAIVRVVDTTIRGTGGDGVRAAGGAQVTITRTVIAGCLFSGILAESGGAGPATTVEAGDTVLDGNQYGLTAITTAAAGEVRVSVHGSRIVRNANAALFVQSNLGAPVFVSATGNLVFGNGTGLVAFNAGTRVWASGNAVTRNDTGFRNAGGLFESAGNNAVRNNGQDLVGAITVVAPS